ncbi:hypothetical protein MJT46_014376 [Ovis ammon polii x Ovis aries]|nr:hypothetical protein MJT46_014376 [Ovis ammon polii x Ovis aries]
MRRERQECFPDQAGKGSHISSYEVETGLLWMWAGPSCFLSSGDRCDGNAQDSLPNKQRMDLSSRTTRRKRSSSGCGRDPRASSRVERGMSGNFLSCNKGVKDPLEVPEMRRERPGFSPEQAANGSLISNYEAETELFWMWAGPTCFLSSGEGAVPRATVVGVHPRREIRGSGAKQVPLEWTETSAGLLECGHDPGVTLAFPVESASSSDAT